MQAGGNQARSIFIYLLIDYTRPLLFWIPKLAIVKCVWEINRMVVYVVLGQESNCFAVLWKMSSQTQP